MPQEVIHNRASGINMKPQPCKPKYPVVWAARRRQPILRLARAAGIAPNADELGMEALPTLSR
jgi:hypothetical protein